MKNNLDSQVFKDDLDFKTLENLLDTLDHIKPERISREEFNFKKGDILEKSGHDEQGELYTLFLPEDLKIGELASIIRRVNRLAFGEALPEYASSIELKRKIVFAIDILLTRLRDAPEMDKKEVQKAIEKYIRLYEDLFPEEDIALINQKNVRQEILAHGNNEKYKEYEQKMVRIQTKEKLGNLLEEMEDALSEELGQHFNETFFERGVHILRNGMKTITQEEGKGVERKDGTIKVRVKPAKLDANAQLLREKIGIDQLRSELDEIRKTKPHEIEQKELEVAEKIIQALYEYPYQLTSDDYGYQPNKILSSKEIYCVGFSLLAHAFLSELGIKHQALNIPEHSAIEVDIGSKKYYLDAANYEKLIQFEYEDKYLSGTSMKSTEKNQYLGSALAGDPERILMSQIYNNKGAGINELDLKNRLFDNAIKLDPNFITVLDNRVWSSSDARRLNEALKYYDEMILQYPRNSLYHIRRGDILWEMKKYEDAMDAFDKAIEFKDKNSADIEFHKGRSLERLGRYREALEEYRKGIGTDPKNATLCYLGAGRSLSALGYYRSGALYFFSRGLLLGRKEGIELLYREKKEIIRGYVETKNYEGLRQYLSDLEKEEEPTIHSL